MLGRGLSRKRAQEALELPIRSLQLTRSPRWVFRLLLFLLALVALVLVVLIAVPWQQTIFAKGEVTRLDPAHRPYKLQAPADGLIEAWQVEEGAVVEAGAPLVTLESGGERFTLRAGQRLEVVRIEQGAPESVVKKGDPLADLLPVANDVAVALEVSDNDIPLLRPGRKVRLMFAGWPAIQFSGWPQVAVGTFGGVVARIDATPLKPGHYRVLVVPDRERIAKGLDQPWPSFPYLRPGTRAHAWIQLATVSLGYELWRRLNNFPPALPEEETIRGPFVVPKMPHEGRPF